MDVTSEHGRIEPAGDGGYRPRSRAIRRNLRCNRWQDALFSGFSQRESLGDLCPGQPVLRDHGSEAEYQRNPRRFQRCICGPARHTGAARHGGENDRQTGPLQINHFGTIAGGHGRFNLRPASRLAKLLTAVDNVIRRLRMPATISATSRERSKEFKTLPEPHGPADRRDSGDLHRARILYESFIHPITILSGLPSAVFGALLTLVIFHKQLDLYCVRGHHHAVRRGEEERDHDDRFRDRCAEARARFRNDAIWSGCLLRFRPDHDDHGGALFGTMPIALVRRRRGCAPAARARCSGRPVVSSVPDPVHHARDLPVTSERVQGWLSGERVGVTYRGGPGSAFNRTRGVLTTISTRNPVSSAVADRAC